MIGFQRHNASTTATMKMLAFHNVWGHWSLIYPGAIGIGMMGGEEEPLADDNKYKTYLEACTKKQMEPDIVLKIVNFVLLDDEKTVSVLTPPPGLAPPTSKNIREKKYSPLKCCQCKYNDTKNSCKFGLCRTCCNNVGNTCQEHLPETKTQRGGRKVRERRRIAIEKRRMTITKR